MASSDGDYVTAREAADILKMNIKTVQRLCRDKFLAGAIKTRGGHWRIPRASVLDYRSGGRAA
jgi:excisionase family DNA binding protein